MLGLFIDYSGTTGNPSHTLKTWPVISLSTDPTMIIFILPFFLIAFHSKGLELIFKIVDCRYMMEKLPVIKLNQIITDIVWSSPRYH